MRNWVCGGIQSSENLPDEYEGLIILVICMSQVFQSQFSTQYSLVEWQCETTINTPTVEKSLQDLEKGGKWDEAKQKNKGGSNNNKHWWTGGGQFFPLSLNIIFVSIFLRSASSMSFVEEACPIATRIHYVREEETENYDPETCSA